VCNVYKAVLLLHNLLLSSHTNINKENFDLLEKKKTVGRNVQEITEQTLLFSTLISTKCKNVSYVTIKKVENYLFHIRNFVNDLYRRHHEVGRVGGGVRSADTVHVVRHPLLAN
jgi:hypothetical protein